jgi:hypothetical protein
MADQSIRILAVFKKQFIKFLDELIAQFPREPDLVIVRIFMKDQVPVADVMCHIICEVLPHEEAISQRKEDFFLKDNELFRELNPDTVIHFKRLWTSKNLEADDRDAIWRWFDAFIMLAKKYQKAIGTTQISRNTMGGYILQ